METSGNCNTDSLVNGKQEWMKESIGLDLTSKLGGGINDSGFNYFELKQSKITL